LTHSSAGGAVVETLHSHVVFHFIYKTRLPSLVQD